MVEEGKASRKRCYQMPRLVRCKCHRRTGPRSPQTTTWNTPISHPWIAKRKQRIHSGNASPQTQPDARHARSKQKPPLPVREIKKVLRCKSANAVPQTLEPLRELSCEFIPFAAAA